jgi:hypothetical protein
MHLISAALDCGDGIDDPQASILMPVPIESDISTLFLDDRLDESNYGTRPVRS